MRDAVRMREVTREAPGVIDATYSRVAPLGIFALLFTLQASATGLLRRPRPGPGGLPSRKERTRRYFRGARRSEQEEHVGHSEVLSNNSRVLVTPRK